MKNTTINFMSETTYGLPGQGYRITRMIYGPIEFFDWTVMIRDLTGDDITAVRNYYATDNIIELKKALDVYGKQENGRGMKRLYLVLEFIAPTRIRRGKLITPKILKNEFERAILVDKKQLSSIVRSHVMDKNTDTWVRDGLFSDHYFSNSDRLKWYKGIIEKNPKKFIEPLLDFCIEDGCRRRGRGIYTYPEEKFYSYVSLYITRISHEGWPL